jgi:hypothetical protein
MTHPYGEFEIRHKEAEEYLKGIGHLMKDSCPPGYGFAFFLFTYGSGGNFFYISSSEREDMIKLMEEFIVKLKGH